MIYSGEWSFEEDMKKVKGSLDIPEFSFGELDDLEVTPSMRRDFDMIREGWLGWFRMIGW